MKRAKHRRRDAKQNREGVGFLRWMSSMSGNLLQLREKKREKKKAITKQMATEREIPQKLTLRVGRVRAMSKYHTEVSQQSSGTQYDKEHLWKWEIILHCTHLKALQTQIDFISPLSDSFWNAEEGCVGFSFISCFWK